MKKQGGILILTVLMAVILCGASSAADNSSTTGGEGNLWVNVNYEYDDKINPEISVTDSHNKRVTFDKTKKSDTLYKLKFTYTGVTNGTQFKVTTGAPGYKNQTKKVTVDQDFDGFTTFNLKATTNYKLGRQVTAKADQKLNFSTADKVLAITTAGVPKLHGTTTEDCIEGILNGSGGKITFGKGNLLMLRQTAVDPVDFAFIVKKGSSLEAICFRNGSSTPVYQGTISQNMAAKQWNSFIAKVGGENGFSYASLANAWNAGVSTDVLREAAFHGHVCEGTIGGYTITKVLLKYYPPIQDSGTGGSPGDITSYKIIGVPGGSDDDAAMYFLDATSGKNGYVGFDTTSTGATENMIGFIRWKDATYKLVNNSDETQSWAVDAPGTGTLIVMQYNQEKNRKDFEKQTGTKLNNDLAELKYNTWLIKKIINRPQELVTIIKAYDNLTEEQYYYITGSAGTTAVTYPNSGNATNKGQLRIPNQEAHGLDMNFINSLNLPTAAKANTTSTINTLTYNQLKKIGTDAANLAKQIFKNELGITLEKDDPNLAVLTSAGYVYLNGQTTEATWDGIYDVLGSRLSRSTILPIHMGLWKPLWFAFVQRGFDGKTMNTVYLHYNPDGTFYIGTNEDGKQANDIGPNALNNATQLSNLGKYVITDGNFFNIQSIANAWRNDPAFDQLMAFLFHDHACPGVQPGFFITDYIFKNYPLTGDQSYFWMASTIYCKDDSLIYLLDVTPGMGSYMNQRLTGDETLSEYIPGGTEEGMIVIWDPETNTGKVAIINFKWPTYNLKGLTTSEAQREAMIAGFVSLYKGETSPFINEPMSLLTSEEKYITEAEFNLIKQGGGSAASALDYVKSLPIRSLTDLIDGSDDDGSSTDGSNSDQPGTPPGGSDNGQSGTNTGSSILPTGSVGESGNYIGTPAQVSAATETGTADEAGTDDSGKAYEITETGPTGTEDNTPWTAYALVGILSIMALAGLGFFFKGSIFGR